MTGNSDRRLSPSRAVRLASAILLAATLAWACSSASTNVTGPSVSKCAVSAASSASTFGPDGGSGSVTISTNSECTWNATSQATWVSFSPAAGQGPGSVSFKVAPNTTPTARSAALVINDQSIGLSEQGAPCRYQVSPVSYQAAPSGGSGQATVSAMSGCQWSAASGVGWINITGGASGNGNGTVQFVVSGNPGSDRTGQLVAAGQPIEVTQPGIPVPTPTPAPVPTPTPAPSPTPRPTPLPTPAPTPTPTPTPTPSPTPTPTPSPTPTPTPTPIPTPTTVAFSGAAGGVTGTCPALSFTVNGVAVVTTSTTDFRGSKCSDIKSGTKVSGSGVSVGGGPVQATWISVQK